MIPKNKGYRAKLCQLYSNMMDRSSNRGHIDPQQHRLQFYLWAEQNGYAEMWVGWFQSGFATRLAPSVDRLDNDKGYEWFNIQLIPWGEHSDKARKPVTQLTMEGKVVDWFTSGAEAAQLTGTNRVNLLAVCRGEQRSSGGFKWRFTDD